MARGCESDSDLNSFKRENQCYVCEKLSKTITYGPNSGAVVERYMWVHFNQKNGCRRCIQDSTGQRTITVLPVKNCYECIDESYQNTRTGMWVAKKRLQEIIPSDECEVCDPETGDIVDRCPDADMECIGGRCLPVCIGGCDADLCQECKCDDPPRCSSRSCHDTCWLNNYECIEGNCTCTLACNATNLPDIMDEVDANGVVTGCKCGCQVAIDGCGTNAFGDQLRFVSETCECVDDYASSSSLNTDLLP